MTTANDIIAQALGLIGIRSSADPVTGADAAICFERLNTLVDALRATSLFAYATQQVTGTLPANTITRTIGPGAQLAVTPKPIRIENGAYFTSGAIDYPIELVNEATYNGETLKTVATIGPQMVFYRPSEPTGTLYFFPTASAAVTLTLPVLTQITAFATLTTDYNLAAGARRMLVFSLAEEVAPDFEREVPPSVARNAMNARRAVQVANVVVPQLEMASGGQDVLGRFWPY